MLLYLQEVHTELAGLGDMKFDDASPRAAQRRMADAESRLRREMSDRLHDGAQQDLVMLLIVLKLLRQAADENAVDLVDLVDEATDHARHAIAGVREVVADILPSILGSQGLVAAVQALGERAAIPVEVHGPPGERADSNLELHAYLVVAQAVTNAVERQASTVSVTVQLGDDVLAVLVSDDGRCDDVARRDDGLSRIADRVGALNGTLEWNADPNQGTTVQASFPVRRGRARSKDHLCR